MSLLRKITDYRLMKRQRSAARAFKRLYTVTARLRAPDGCPWDKEQTPETTRTDLLEECYETVEAINDQDAAHVCEEIGDVLLNTAMLAYMYEQAGQFTVTDSLNDVADKIIRRHPHVFAGNKNNIQTADQVLTQWDAIKSNIEGRKQKSLMDEVSLGLPPLKRAQKLQKKAAKVGFDWPDTTGVCAKLREEVTELEEALQNVTQDSAHAEEELGDVIFSLVNLARHYHLDAEQALIRANQKFVARFKHMETAATANNVDFASLSLEEKDTYWNNAKKSRTLTK